MGNPKDFLTLLRNAILTKLIYHLKLNVQQVLSTNGNYIYILIYADER